MKEGHLFTNKLISGLCLKITPENSREGLNKPFFEALNTIYIVVGLIGNGPTK